MNSKYDRYMEELSYFTEGFYDYFIVKKSQWNINTQTIEIDVELFSEDNITAEECLSNTGISILNNFKNKNQSCFEQAKTDKNVLNRLNQQFKEEVKEEVETKIKENTNDIFIALKSQDKNIGKKPKLKITINTPKVFI